MKLKHIFCTTALSIAVAAGSYAAFAQSNEESLDPVDRHGGLEVEITEAENQEAEAKAAPAMADKHDGDAKMKDDTGNDAELNTNNVDVMREQAADMGANPNAATRAVPGAPHAGKNPDIDPVAGEHDFVE